jgi:hypothetical protein
LGPDREGSGAPSAIPDSTTGYPAGKFSDKRQVATHRHNCLPEGGKQQVATFFQAENLILGDPESVRHAHLGELAGLPEFPQGHSSAMSATSRASIPA